MTPAATIGGWPLHCALMASAGTGKTHQLSTRFIGLVSAGAQPRTILATTFTREAAGEILARVLKRLALAGSDGAALDTLNRELRADGREPLSRERATGLAACVARSVHRLSIMTLDAWFARVASGFGLELGLPAAWSILEETDDERVRSAAVHRALEEADRERLVDALEALAGGVPRRNVHASLLQAVGVAHGAFLDTRSDARAWEAIGPEGAAVSVEDAKAALAGLRDALTKAGGKRVHWTNAKAALADAIDARDAHAILKNALMAASRARAGTYAGEPILPEDARALDPAFAFAAGVCLEELRRRNAAVFDLLARFDACYERLKAAAGGLCFDDVPRRLVAGSMGGRLDDLYFRLDARVHHLLLDEFQDTSRSQYEAIAPVIEEALAVGDGSRTILCVGDAKQSLYGWRGATPELLRRLPRRYPHAVATADLRRSYRSSRGVLEAVNEVFRSPATNPALAARPPGALWRDPFPLHEPNDPALPGSAVLLAGPPFKGLLATQRRAEMAGFVAGRVAHLLGACREASIAVLVRANARIPAIIHALRSAGIQAAEHGGGRLTDAPPVAAALSLIHFAEHPGDSAALFHAGSSPLGRALRIDPRSLARGRHTASQVRRQLAQAGFADTLARWERLSINAMDAHGAARFDALVALAARFDARARTSLSEFLALARAATVEDASPAPVRVMTIHASKGLEFDGVVLPDLDAPWRASSSSVALRRADAAGVDDPLAPVVEATLHPPRHLHAASARLSALAAHRLAGIVDDELCCLYVAMTRARHVLEMIVPESDKAEAGASAAGVLRGALAPGSRAPAGEVLWSFEHAGGTPWPEAVRARLARAGPAPAPPVETPLRLAPAGQPPVWKLARSAPSALEGGRIIDLKDAWLAESEGLSYGSLMHAWLARVEWSDDPAPSDADLIEAALAEGLDPQDARSRLDAFRALLAAVAPALARSRYPRDAAPEVRREWPFVVRDRDPATGAASILSGRFDRLVVWRGTTPGAEVLDFKTDQADTPQALADAMARYRPQLDAYRRAAASLLRLPESSVRGCLVFTGTGTIAE